MTLDKAIVLAAGRGTRMRSTHDAASLTSNQTEVAETGLKAMMPVGRPFIDYVLSGLADAGYRRVCLVVGPQHDVLRDHCATYTADRLDIRFAVQREATGTASAVAAAADFVGDESFLLLNSDNYYPASALIELRHCRGSAVAGFRPEGFLRGNIGPERLRSFAMLVAGPDGTLKQVTEKPPLDYSVPSDGSVLIGMNCWRFSPVIIEACRKIPKSARGEFELTDAVGFAIDRLEERFEVVVVDEPVLDLTTRADVAEVTRRLSTVQVHL